MKCTNCNKVKFPFTVDDFLTDRWLNKDDFCYCEVVKIDS